MFGESFLPSPAFHVGSDDEVPSYILLPEERARELEEKVGLRAPDHGRSEPS